MVYLFRGDQIGISDTYLSKEKEEVRMKGKMGWNLSDLLNVH